MWDLDIILCPEELQRSCFATKVCELIENRSFPEVCIGLWNHPHGKMFLKVCFRFSSVQNTRWERTPLYISLQRFLYNNSSTGCTKKKNQLVIYVAIEFFANSAFQCAWRGPSEHHMQTGKGSRESLACDTDKTPRNLNNVRHGYVG